MNRMVTPRGLGADDAPHLTPVTPGEDFRTVLINNVSWGAVMAGAVIALMTQILLNILAVAIGVAALPNAGADAPETFPLAAAIWWTVSGIVAAFIGGYAAGRLSGRPKESTAGWHALASWCVTMLAVFALMTTAVGALAGGALGLMARGLNGNERIDMVGLAARAALVGPTVTRPSAAVTGGPSTPSTQAAQAPIQGEIPSLTLLEALSADTRQSDALRMQAVQDIARARQVSPEEASTILDEYQRRYTSALSDLRQETRVNAQEAARIASTAAFFSFAALIVGALLAWLGGRLGAVDPTVTMSHRGRL